MSVAVATFALCGDCAEVTHVADRKNFSESVAFVNVAIYPIFIFPTFDNDVSALKFICSPSRVNSTFSDVLA